MGVSIRRTNAKVAVAGGGSKVRFVERCLQILLTLGINKVTCSNALRVLQVLKKF